MAQSKADSDAFQCGDSPHSNPNTNTTVQKEIASGEGNKEAQGAPAEIEEHREGPPSDTATRTQDNREKDSKNKDRKEGSTKTESAVDASSSHSVSELSSTPTDAKNQGDDPQSNIDTEEDSKKDNEDGQTKQGENKEVQGTPVETEQHGDGPQSDTTTRTQDNREKHSENEERKEETKQKMSSTHSDETSREEEDGEKGNKHADRKEESGLPKSDTRPSGNSSSNNDDKSKDEIIVHPPETILYADSLHPDPNTNTNVQRGIDSEGATAETGQRGDSPPSDTATRTQDNREEDSKNEDRKEDAGSTKTESAVDALSSHSVSELTSTPTDAKNQGDDPQSNTNIEDSEDGQTKQGENKEVQGTPVETEQHGDGPQSDTTTRTQDNREKHSENEDRKEETKQKMSSTHSDETSREEEDGEKGNKHAERKEDSGLPKSDTRPSGNSSSNNDDKSKDGNCSDSPHLDPNTNTNVQRGKDSGGEKKEVQGTPAEIGQCGDGPPSDTATRTQDSREKDSKHENRNQDTVSTEKEPAVDVSSLSVLVNESEAEDKTKQKMSSTHSDETSREEEDGERNSEHEDRKEDAGSTERDSAVHASSSHSMTSNEYKAEDIIDNRGVDPSVTKPRKTSFVGETETRADTDNRDHARHQESPHDTASPGVSKEREKQSILQSDKMIKICGAIIVLLLPVVLAVLLYIPDSTPPVQKEFDVVDKFNQEMETVQSSFPNQRPELWKRSLIHLRRHLKTANPTEPVSLILTSGHGAERTLGCLAQRLAKAFSAALNSSHLDINGKSTASKDSDRVKLDIDSNLKNAFENKKRAAVIHHFEELPPGSTLIFYRYCDHENAAYKKVFLAFTVMLDAGVEDPSNASLGRVEEMVQEHLQHKFVSSDKAALFNEMDVDKLSGLWSRISHLILPVAAEENIEQQGCGA